MNLKRKVLWDPKCWEKHDLGGTSLYNSKINFVLELFKLLILEESDAVKGPIWGHMEDTDGLL